MLDKIKELASSVQQFQANSAESLEQFRLKFLSKKGEIGQLFDEFRTVPAEMKKQLGAEINKLKQFAQQKYDDAAAALENAVSDDNRHDLTRPGEPFEIGTRHPISIVKNEIVDIFSRIGFTVAEGPEVEDDWHVFSAMNFAAEHPARDMQDTFFVEKKSMEPDPHDILLRTHTSSVQSRIMEKRQPPIRMIFPGRVFRNEAISARAHCIFHQVEGLYVAENVSFADLKQTLLYFAKEMFGNDTIIRLRPSYFPFTEPSAEMDVSCSICGGKGCNICKGTGWLEILGCGMVDPNVLKNCGIDSEKYTGFAFGMGVERIAMLKYQVRDLRLYFENDIRFLKQFKSAY